MATKPIVDVLLGGIRHGPVQFIKHHVAKKPKQNFELVLPGQVIRCNGVNALLSIMPYARVTIPGGRVSRFAVLAAQVTNQGGLQRVGRDLDRRVSFKDVQAFAVRLASDTYTYLSVVEAAEGAVGGCDCAKGGFRGATILTTLEVGVVGKSNKNMVWSKPVHAKVKASAGDDVSNGEYDSVADFVAHIFDCHAEWWIRGFYDEFLTTCEGPCPKNICNCGKDKRGNRQIACDGWWPCTCF